MNESPAFSSLPYNHRLEEPVTVWQWIKTLLITMIPLVGIIMIFYWAFSAHGNSNRRNYMRAFLIIRIPLVIIAGAIIGYAITHELHERAINASEAPSHPSLADPQPEASAPLRMLKGTDGRTIEAAVIGFPRPGHVQIRRADGKVFTVEVSKFSAEDIAYFNQLRAAAERR